MPTKTEKKLETFSELETQQIENSAKLAAEFIEESILPILTEFEFQNDDEEYMAGFATHSLFAWLVQQLGQMGYTEKELRKEIKLYLNTSIGQVLH
jgi:hypothetical protein